MHGGQRRGWAVGAQAASGEALALLLSDAERRLTRRLTTLLSAPRLHGRALAGVVLLAHGESHRMSELAEFTQLPPASLTRLIDGMVADNLVHRKPDPRDRRGVLVHLTDRGLALQARSRSRSRPSSLLGDLDRRAARGAAGLARRPGRALALIAHRMK